MLRLMRLDDGLITEPRSYAMNIVMRLCLGIDKLQFVSDEEYANITKGFSEKQITFYDKFKVFKWSDKELREAFKCKCVDSLQVEHRCTALDYCPYLMWYNMKLLFPYWMPFMPIIDKNKNLIINSVEGNLINHPAIFKQLIDVVRKPCHYLPTEQELHTELVEENNLRPSEPRTIHKQILNRLLFARKALRCDQKVEREIVRITGYDSNNYDKKGRSKKAFTLEIQRED